MRLRFLAVLVTAVSAAACGANASSSSPAPSPPAPWGGAIIQHPVAKADVLLADTSGHPFNIARDTQGKVTLVYYGYTNCPDRCPADMAGVANALKQLTAEQRAQIVVVFVTTDPARDTGPALRRFLDRFNPSFVGLTGSAEDLAMAQRAAGVTLAVPETPSPGASGYGVDHAAFVLVYSLDGKAHEAFPGGVSVATEAADLRRLVAAEVPG